MNTETMTISTLETTETSPGSNDSSKTGSLTENPTSPPLFLKATKQIKSKIAIEENKTRVFVVTHNKTGYNLDNSKNYEITVFTEKTEAVQQLKKNFMKAVKKAKLNEKKKEEITCQFNQSLLQGKFQYHFRDTADLEEPQYFGKIHTRYIEI